MVSGTTIESVEGEVVGGELEIKLTLFKSAQINK